MTTDELRKAVQAAHEMVMGFDERTFTDALNSGLLDSRCIPEWEERNGPLTSKRWGRRVEPMKVTITAHLQLSYEIDPAMAEQAFGTTDPVEIARIEEGFLRDDGDYFISMLDGGVMDVEEFSVHVE